MTPNPSLDKPIESKDMMPDTSSDELIERLGLLQKHLLQVDEDEAAELVSKAADLIQSLQAKLDEKDVVIGRKDERIAKLETALNEVFDFLGGVDGASDMRDLLLADFLQRPPENSR